MADGVTKCEVMSRDEVESIRKRSKAGGSGPWVSDWCEMAKKTAFRRASKWLPLSPEINDAFDKDQDRIVDAVSVDAVSVVAQDPTPNRTLALEQKLDALLGSDSVSEVAEVK
jgi:recombination protein RecT